MDKACVKHNFQSRYRSQTAPTVYIHGLRPNLSYQLLSIAMAPENSPFGTTTEIQHQIQSNVNVLFQHTRGPFETKAEFTIIILRSNTLPGYPYVAVVSYEGSKIYIQGPVGHRKFLKFGNSPIREYSSWYKLLMHHSNATEPRKHWRSYLQRVLRHYTRNWARRCLFKLVRVCSRESRLPRKDSKSP